MQKNSFSNNDEHVARQMSGKMQTTKIEMTKVFFLCTNKGVVCNKAAFIFMEKFSWKKLQWLLNWNEQVGDVAAWKIFVAIHIKGSHFICKLDQFT